MKGINQMTKMSNEELERAILISESYNNEQDIYNDLYAKIELFKNLSVDNSTIEYSLSMYATEVQILLQALNYYYEE